MEKCLCCGSFLHRVNLDRTNTAVLFCGSTCIKSYVTKRLLELNREFEKLTDLVRLVKEEEYVE